LPVSLGLAQSGSILEFENDMKTHWMGGLLLCSMAAAANAQTPDGGQLQAGSEGAPALVLPISVLDDDHRSTSRLRDVLRQAGDDAQEPDTKPYRLSPEERLRLREQLRSQPGAEPSKGKS